MRGIKKKSNKCFIWGVAKQNQNKTTSKDKLNKENTENIKVKVKLYSEM